MDLVGALRNLSAADFVLLLLFLAAFVFGFAQGAVRVLFYLLAWLAAFLIAINLETLAGDFLGQYWITFSPAYNHMIAGLILYLVVFVGSGVAIQLFTRRTPLHTGLELADEAIGGVLALFVAALVIGCFIGLEDTYYLNHAAGGTAEMPWLHDLDAWLRGSGIVNGLRSSLLPGLVTVAGPLMPDGLRTLFN